jgi:flagellum-specific ATP synthase
VNNAAIQYFQNIKLIKSVGRVSSFIGTVLEVDGINASVGEYFQVFSSEGKAVKAEAVGFRGQKVMLMPFHQPRGIKLNDPVVSEKNCADIGVGESLLGRVVDSFGKPLDGKGNIEPETFVPLYPEPGNPLDKAPVKKLLNTGIKAIDAFLNLGKGQRLGIFAGSGVGKTTIFKTLSASSMCDIKVICLIGERGREVVDLVNELEASGELKKSVVVAATSDQPALVRSHAIFCATAISEYFSRRGDDVLLLADSITRHALAQREIGLAVGEPPTLRGYTPSVFAQLPLLIERVGAFKNGGSITGIYTVLVEGGDLDEPVSDNMRAILDGHVVLSRELAEQGHYPAIDIQKSRSRVRDFIVSDSHLSAAQTLYQSLVDYEKVRDFLEVGGYRRGENLELDNTVDQYTQIMEWLSSSNGIYRSDIIQEMKALAS